MLFRLSLVYNSILFQFFTLLLLFPSFSSVPFITRRQFVTACNYECHVSDIKEGGEEFSGVQ